MSKIVLGAISTYTIPTEKFLKDFGLSSWDLEDINVDGPSDDEVRQIALDWDIPEESLQKTVEGDFGTETVEEAIRRIYLWAYESGTRGAFEKAIVSAVEQILETFSDYPYEYFSEGEFKSFSGRAKGIIPNTIQVDMDNITFQAEDDLANIVQDCIAGVGMFDVDSEFEGETPHDYAQSRLHWLKEYFEVYGTRMPKVDEINYEFDTPYYDSLMRDLVKSLTPAKPKKRRTR